MDGRLLVMFETLGAGGKDACEAQGNNNSKDEPGQLTRVISAELG